MLARGYQLLTSMRICGFPSCCTIDDSCTHRSHEQQRVRSSWGGGKHQPWLHPSTPPPAGCGSALPSRPCIDHKMQQAGLVFYFPLSQAGIEQSAHTWNPLPHTTQKSQSGQISLTNCAPPLLIMQTMTRSLFAGILCLSVSCGHPRSSTVGTVGDTR